MKKIAQQVTYAYKNHDESEAHLLVMVAKGWKLKDSYISSDGKYRPISEYSK